MTAQTNGARSLLVPRPGILDIAPYVPGRSAVPGGGPVIKLSSNESPLGPSPKAIEAFRAAAATLDRYPDGGAQALKEAIGEAFNLPPAQIVCGTGSDELIYLLARAYLGPGDQGIFPEHGFLIHKLAMLGAGATPVAAAEVELTASVDAILACVTPKTRAVFLANPDNPTGTYVPAREVLRLRTSLPDNALLVVDSAYADYVTRLDYSDGAALVHTTQNTVMLRTFSKIYGLAALRLGWAFCPPEVADILNRIRGPFNVSGPAQAAGIAALSDVAHVQVARAHNETWSEWLTVELRGLGFKVTPSAGNFVLVHFEDAPGKTAAAADAFLLENRIILRGVAAYGLPNALRLTVGRQEENRAVVAALAKFAGK